jgi:hypothetical protein
MEIKATGISFELKYGGKPVFCEAIVQQNGMQIYFNGSYIATMDIDAAAGWRLTEGTILPQEIVENIGAHIDGYLD